jgi:peptide/nickel transport system permease protein
MAQVPLTVPPEVKEKMREALGLGRADACPLLEMARAVLLDRAAAPDRHWFGTRLCPKGQLRVISAGRPARR